MSEFVQEQQPEPRVLPPRMTERVQALTELRRDETTTEEPRVPTTFVERLQQFMRQENIGVSALAKRLGKSHGTVSKWLSDADWFTPFAVIRSFVPYTVLRVKSGRRQGAARARVARFCSFISIIANIMNLWIRS